MDRLLSGACDPYRGTLPDKRHVLGYAEHIRPIFMCSYTSATQRLSRSRLRMSAAAAGPAALPVTLPAVFSTAAAAATAFSGFFISPKTPCRQEDDPKDEQSYHDRTHIFHQPHHISLLWQARRLLSHALFRIWCASREDPKYPPSIHGSALSTSSPAPLSSWECLVYTFAGSFVFTEMPGLRLRQPLGLHRNARSTLSPAPWPSRRRRS